MRAKAECDRTLSSLLTGASITDAHGKVAGSTGYNARPKLNHGQHKRAVYERRIRPAHKNLGQVSVRWHAETSTLPVFPAESEPAGHRLHDPLPMLEYVFTGHAAVCLQSKSKEQRPAMRIALMAKCPRAIHTGARRSGNAVGSSCTSCDPTTDKRRKYMIVAAA